MAVGRRGGIAVAIGDAVRYDNHSRPFSIWLGGSVGGAGECLFLLLSCFLYFGLDVSMVLWVCIIWIFCFLSSVTLFECLCVVLVDGERVGDGGAVCI